MRIHPKSLQELNLSQIFQINHGASFSFEIGQAQSSNSYLCNIRAYDYTPIFARNHLKIEKVKLKLPQDGPIPIAVELTDGKAVINLTRDRSGALPKPNPTNPDLYLGFYESLNGNVAVRRRIGFLVFSSFV